MPIETNVLSTSAPVLVRPEARLPRWEGVLEDPAHAPTILIVDDVELNRHLFKAMLKAEMVQMNA